MYSKKFNDHNYMQAQVNYYNDGTIALQSYSTIVIEIVDSWLKVNGLYSRTTIKHIGLFMRELGLTYYDAKALYTDNKEMNIITGEIRERC